MPKGKGAHEARLKSVLRARLGSSSPGEGLCWATPTPCPRGFGSGHHFLPWKADRGPGGADSCPPHTPILESTELLRWQLPTGSQGEGNLGMPHQAPSVPCPPASAALSSGEGTTGRGVPRTGCTAKVLQPGWQQKVQCHRRLWLKLILRCQS